MKNLLLAFSMVALIPITTLAQKIAYADVNAILGVMPENEKINEDLQIYAMGLQKPLGDMKAELEAMGKQFQQVLAAKDTAKALEIQKQALEGEKKFQEADKKAEQQLAQKRSEALQPVLNRMRKAMETVAKKNGFDYVMNSIDGSGTSIVLWGPEGHDITGKVVEELGIDLKQQAPSPNSDNGKKKGK